MSGVPVFSTAGRGGGWRLVGGSRTDLSGLTGPEIRALFLAAGSVPGQSPAVQSALAKLQRAVPAPFREQAAHAAEAIFVDAAPAPSAEESPSLALLQEAVALGVRVELAYRDRTGRSSDRTVDPLGLVSRGRAGTSSATPGPVGVRSASTGRRTCGSPTTPCGVPRTSTSARHGPGSPTSSIETGREAA